MRLLCMHVDTCTVACCGVTPRDVHAAIVWQQCRWPYIVFAESTTATRGVTCFAVMYMVWREAA
jgi:hypothetical protein